MNPDREQAIKDVAAALGCDDLILSQFICNNGEYKVYAVRQRERVIQMERALREIKELPAHPMRKKSLEIASAALEGK